MIKKPLSHTQMAIAIGATLVLAGPAFYLAVFKSSPWLALITLALSQGFLAWKKRHPAAN